MRLGSQMRKAQPRTAPARPARPRCLHLRWRRAALTLMPSRTVSVFIMSGAGPGVVHCATTLPGMHRAAQASHPGVVVLTWQGTVRGGEGGGQAAQPCMLSRALTQAAGTAWRLGRLGREHRTAVRVGRACKLSERVHGCTGASSPPLQRAHSGKRCGRWPCRRLCGHAMTNLCAVPATTSLPTRPIYNRSLP